MSCQFKVLKFKPVQLRKHPPISACPQALHFIATHLGVVGEVLVEIGQ